MNANPHFDIVTLFVTEVIVCSIFSMVLYVLARRFRDVRGTMRLAQGFLLGVIATFFFLLRPFVPLPVSVIFGNGLIGVAYLMFYVGGAELLGVRPRLRLPIIVTALSIVLLAYFSTVYNLITTRTIIVAVTGVLLPINLLTDLVRHNRRSVVVRSLIAFVVLCMVSDAIRAVATAIYGVPDNIFQDSFAQALHLLVALFAACGLGIFSMALVAREITASIERSARRDPLTGTLNRRGIEELLAIEVERARRTRVPLSLALLDIDHFKIFNDTGGHAAGDDVLRNVVAAISHHLRPFDTCGRMGGDEFLILLPGSTALDMSGICDRILREMASLPPHPAAGIAPTLSIGFTEADIFDTVVDVLGRADRALYAAKHQGRNRAQMELAPIQALPPETPTTAIPGKRFRLRRATSTAQDSRS